MKLLFNIPKYLYMDSYLCKGSSYSSIEGYSSVEGTDTPCKEEYGYYVGDFLSFRDLKNGIYRDTLRSLSLAIPYRLYNTFIQLI